MTPQAANLPRKAPKDTLPMPAANTQKQKKCSRNSECSEVRNTKNREEEEEIKARHVGVNRKQVQGGLFTL